jgi:hypothetical protein
MRVWVMCMGRGQMVVSFTDLRTQIGSSFEAGDGDFSFRCVGKPGTVSVLGDFLD